MIQTSVECNCWRIEAAEFVVVRDGLKPLSVRNLFDALGIVITQILNSVEGSMINSFTNHF